VSKIIILLLLTADLEVAPAMAIEGQAASIMVLVIQYYEGIMVSGYACSSVIIRDLLYCNILQYYHH
jgi:hypothetical protein